MDYKEYLTWIAESLPQTCSMLRQSLLDQLADGEQEAQNVHTS